MVGKAKPHLGLKKYRSAVCIGSLVDQYFVLWIGGVGVGWLVKIFKASCGRNLSFRNYRDTPLCCENSPCEAIGLVTSRFVGVATEVPRVLSML